MLKLTHYPARGRLDEYDQGGMRGKASAFSRNRPRAVPSRRRAHERAETRECEMRYCLFFLPPARLARAALLCLAALLVCLSAPLSPAARAAEALPVITGEGLLEIVRANPGKVVFINFFASWCPPCREEIPELITIRKEYPETALTLIGVALDEKKDEKGEGADPLASFAASAGFNYPVYRAGADVPGLYGVMSIPHNVVYDTQGKLAVSQAGMVDAAALRVFFDAVLKNDAKGGAK